MKAKTKATTNSETPRFMMKSKSKNRLEAILDVYKLRGFRWSTNYFILSIAGILFSPLWSSYYKYYYDPGVPKNTFTFHSLSHKKFSYFRHPYNITWANERAIEIPLIKYYMKGVNPAEILELGNVMSHYIKIKHDIVDEYENDPGIINVDIMKYHPKKKYNLIISVSTLEHVGVDGEKEPEKALKTIQHLKTLLSLSPKGKIVFTIPIGYHKILDKTFYNDITFLSEAYFFRRISGDNKWVEVDKHAGFRGSYGFPYRWGNSIILGIIKK